VTTTDLKSKYRNLMAHRRDKKWPLMQRTEYEAQRTHSLSQSRRTGTESRFTQDPEQKYLSVAAEENRVVINERLKNLLFS
jgi:hypothetical protein